MNKDREVKTQIYYTKIVKVCKSGPQFARGDLNKSSCNLQLIGLTVGFYNWFDFSYILQTV